MDILSELMQWKTENPVITASQCIYCKIPTSGNDVCKKCQERIDRERNL